MTFINCTWTCSCFFFFCLHRLCNCQVRQIISEKTSPGTTLLTLGMSALAGPTVRAARGRCWAESKNQSPLTTREPATYREKPCTRVAARAEFRNISASSEREDTRLSTGWKTPLREHWDGVGFTENASRRRRVWEAPPGSAGPSA